MSTNDSKENWQLARELDALCLETQQILLEQAHAFTMSDFSAVEQKRMIKLFYADPRIARHKQAIDHLYRTYYRRVFLEHQADHAAIGFLEQYFQAIIDAPHAHYALLAEDYKTLKARLTAKRWVFGIQSVFSDEVSLPLPNIAEAVVRLRQDGAIRYWTGPFEALQDAVTVRRDIISAKTSARIKQRFFTEQYALLLETIAQSSVAAK